MEGYNKFFRFRVSRGDLEFYSRQEKTTNPVLCGIVGFLTGFMPPLGLIFLAVLVLKNDKQRSYFTGTLKVFGAPDRIFLKPQQLYLKTTITHFAILYF